jgi:putative acetyltransferase
VTDSIGPAFIRSERPGDEDAIRIVHESAFPGPGEACLVAALRRSGLLMVSLIAEEAGAIVGHVAFSPVSVAGTRTGFALGPVAVIPARQRAGIGSALVRRGLDACRQAAVPFIVVLGDPAYYSRFGFGPASARGLIDEYRGGVAFQALELRMGGIPPEAGLVRYADEFTLVAGSAPPSGDRLRVP